LVIAGVTGRVDHPQAIARRHAYPVRRLDDALGRDRDRRRVLAVNDLVAEHGAGALLQARRVDQVRGGVRMRVHPRPRQFDHERPNAGGVIEMGVGGDDRVDRVTADAFAFERGE
jgi:hypothetical protein